MIDKLALAALVAAAILEVWGDRTVGNGLSGGRWFLVVAGCAVLAIYGIVVNSYNVYVVRIAREHGGLAWDFGRLLGLYVAFFAMTAVIWSAIADPTKPTKATLLGVIVIAIGGAIIHFGNA